MKIRFQLEQLGEHSPLQFLRRAGYSPLGNRQTGDPSFVKRLSSDFYPRFHIYLDLTSQPACFNLHLDQKKASYDKQTAHSGEYDGDLVEQEAARLSALMINHSLKNNSDSSSSNLFN